MDACIRPWGRSRGPRSGPMPLPSCRRAGFLCRHPGLSRATGSPPPPASGDRRHGWTGACGHRLCSRGFACARQSRGSFTRPRVPPFAARPPTFMSASPPVCHRVSLWRHRTECRALLPRGTVPHKHTALEQRRTAAWGGLAEGPCRPAAPPLLPGQVRLLSLWGALWTSPACPPSRVLAGWGARMAMTLLARVSKSS